MNSIAPSQDKILVNCSHGADDPERATIAFVLAVTASKTCETAVFLTADGAGLCVPGGAERIAAAGYEPLRDLLAQYRANGGEPGRLTNVVPAV